MRCSRTVSRSSPGSGLGSRPDPSSPSTSTLTTKASVGVAADPCQPCSSRASRQQRAPAWSPWFPLQAQAVCGRCRRPSTCRRFSRRRRSEHTNALPGRFKTAPRGPCRVGPVRILRPVAGQPWWLALASRTRRVSNGAFERQPIGKTGDVEVHLARTSDVDRRCDRRQRGRRGPTRQAPIGRFQVVHQFLQARGVPRAS